MNIPVPFLFLIFFCTAAFAQVQGETPALTPLTSNLGTYLVAMPTYTYSRPPGKLGLTAEEETWHPDKWKNRQVFGRFVPIMDWNIEQNKIWFFTGNEIGDELWQELVSSNDEVNRTPMFYGGFATPPINGFYAMAQFNQIDHFSGTDFETRKNRVNTMRYSLVGENLPAYSGAFGGFGYNNNGNFFKNASVMTGSEFLWAWDENEWVPIRISPRVETNAELYFMEKKIELHAATEKFQIKDSTAESRHNFGLRMSGKNTGGGFLASLVEDQEEMIAWVNANHSYFGFTNRGFIAATSDGEEIYFADSLEYKIYDITIGFMFNQKGVKLYSETVYDSKPLFAKTKIYQNYTQDFESIGFDSEIAYKSSIAEAGAAYSREFFEYYKTHIFYDIKPPESTSKIFVKYRFLKNLIFAHEWVYRDTWFWNAQIEQKIPQLNASLYAVWLNAISNERKDFPFGGANRARFFCGINAGF